MRHLLAPFPFWRPLIPLSVALLRCVSFTLARMKNSRRILAHSYLEIVLGSHNRIQKPGLPQFFVRDNPGFLFFLPKALTLTLRHGLYCSRKEGISMMTVHEVSRRTGVSVRTLQYYDKMGLLPRRRAQKRPIGCMTMRHWNAYSRFCCFARWRFRSKRFRRFCKARTLTGIGR